MSLAANSRVQPVVLRRLALFLSMLLSGGILLVPRVPVLVLVLALCLLVNGFRLPLRRALWPLYVLLSVVLVATLIRPGSADLIALVIRFANFAAALMLLNVYLLAPPGSLLRDLQVLLWPMALQALATVALAHTADFLFVPLNFSDTKYRTLLLLFTYHVTVEDAGGLIRPDGFFFEPGVFQIYLNLYLYLALFAAHNFRRAAVGALAVLATQSTTGILICIVLVGVALVTHGRSGGARRKGLLLLAALLIAPPLLYLGYDNVQTKLFGQFQGSSWAREYDLFTGLNILMDKPLLGIGFGAGPYLAAAQTLGFEETLLNPEGLAERTTSNGLLQLFASLGVPLGSLFLIGVLRQRCFKHRALIALWFTLSMFGEALIFTPFFLLLPFSAFVWVRSSRRRGLPAAPTRPVAP